MKHFFIAICLLISIPTYAACLIDAENSSCSIAEFQQQQPMQRTYSPKSQIKEFAGSPEARLKPSQDDRPRQELRSFGPKPGDYSYNSSCQFGVCYDSGAPQLFENRGQ